MERVDSQRGPMRLPQTIGESGLVVLDATWGEIKPMILADGLRAVGELEVIEHLEAGLPMIDSRKAESHAAGTIPGARNVPFRQAAERLDELDPQEPTVIFCNGPQCGATPNAIDAMLEAGYPPGAILYYRGGLHDWVSLGLPLEPPG